MTTSQTPLTFGNDPNVFAKIDQVIQRHITEFQKPRVLTVRPGFEIVGGKLTRIPAIVVTVRKKVDTVPAGQAIPTQVEGIPVDIRQAGMLDLMRSDDPQRYAVFLSNARREMVPPTFPYERDVTSGLPLSATFGDTALAAAAPAKQKIPYTAPQGTNLNRVSEAMALTLNVSPDAGWVTLKDFFGAIQNKLTAGMYDFTAKHIVDELLAQLKRAGAPLTLTLDHPAPNPTRDQTDDETHTDLEQALGEKLSFAWALERMDPKVSVYIYQSAYHIKVAVSDGKRMWLSSGNWNNSNQPKIDTSHGANSQINAVAKKSDRDWHVVVDHAGLASTFETFLQHDFDVASQQETNAALLAAAGDQSSAATLTDDEMNEMLAGISVRPRVPEQYFQPKRLPATGTRVFAVQPLLTPDPGVYTGQVLALIQSAQRKFYMQTQYIHPSDNAGDQGLTDLINAVISAQHRGVDVRIILSQWQVQNDKNGNPVWWERLQQTGLDLSAVKIQSGVHNKGIVVDSKTVMISSQNWSGDGVLRNRDAGLIIFDEEAAQYFEQVFLHDWQFMAQAGPLDTSIDSRSALAPAAAHPAVTLMSSLAASSGRRRRRALREGETPLDTADIPPAYRVALKRLGLVSVERFVSVASKSGPLLSNYLGTPVGPLTERLSERMPARAPLPPMEPVGLGAILTEPVNAVLPTVDLAAAAFDPTLALAPAVAPLLAGAVAGATPSADVTLIPDMQPIRNQAQRGTCVAHACIAAMEHFYKTQRAQSLDFSEQFLFCLSKQHDGYPQSDGTFVRVAMPLLFTDGCCLEQTWPYNPVPTPANIGQCPPPAGAADEAARFRIPGPNALDPKSVAGIKAELVRGRCVAIAVPFYDSVWLADEIRRSGDIGLPVPGDTADGGHAVCLVGYEDLLDEPEIGGGRFIVRNSWNGQWGTACPYGVGYGTIPYAYVTTYGREAYSIQ